MSAEIVAVILAEKHIESISIGSGLYRDTYAFIPRQFTSGGLPVLGGAYETAYVQYETPQALAENKGGFAEENPSKSRITGVADSQVVYEKIINEKLPLKGQRILFSHRRATKKVCSALGIDAKPHIKQQKNSILRHWGIV